MKDNSEIHIGDRIRELRKGIRLTQKEFGDRIGINQTQVARYERGETIPSLSITVRLSIALNVSLDRLVFGETSHSLDNEVELSRLLGIVEEYYKQGSEKEKAYIKNVITDIFYKR